MMRRGWACATCAFLLAACSDGADRPETSRGSDEAWAQLPEPVSNNAVASATVNGRMMAYSFAGLHAGKTWQDVTANAYACDLEARACEEIDGVPDGVGRLASVAATAGNQIYVFGGYTVAEDGSERSTPEVWQFDPQTETYVRASDIPIPTDDAVAVTYQDRFIYLISGWHDTDNIDAVQVYDTAEGRWFSATSWPGSPVFGHAGGIVDNHIVVCGGVEVVPPVDADARRTFEHYDACWQGEIDPTDPAVIDWSPAPGHQGPARYRAAAIGSQRAGIVYFVGGTNNPYNYNGIGYNGEPAPALDSIMHPPGQGEIDGSSWRLIVGYGTFGTMDHRGLIEWDGAFFTLGGMNGAQEVISDVRAIRID